MRLCRDIRGSFTLEASLVLPTIFCTVLILLFFCLYLYQNVILGQAAAVAAERSAYTWDNSYRDSVTGSYEEGKYDPLYWRLSDDGMLQAIFDWGDQTKSAQIELPAEDHPSDSLQLQKLKRIGGKIPKGLKGEIGCNNGLLRRKVTVSLGRLVSLSPLESVLGDVTQTGRSESCIVEPVEWIRMIALGRYYGAKFNDAAGNESLNRLEAGKALKMFGKR